MTKSSIKLKIKAFRERTSEQTKALWNMSFGICYVFLAFAGNHTFIHTNALLWSLIAVCIVTQGGWMIGYNFARYQNAK